MCSKNCDYQRTIMIIMLSRASHAPARRDSQSSDLLSTCSLVAPTDGVPSLRLRTKPHAQLLSSVAAIVARSGFLWCGGQSWSLSMSIHMKSVPITAWHMNGKHMRALVPRTPHRQYHHVPSMESIQYII